MSSVDINCVNCSKFAGLGWSGRANLLLDINPIFSSRPRTHRRLTLPKLSSLFNDLVSSANCSANMASFTPFDAADLFPCSTSCDWAVEQCHMIGLPSKNCQRLGCLKYLHHLCSIKWEGKNNIPEGTPKCHQRKLLLQFQQIINPRQQQLLPLLQQLLSLPASDRKEQRQ